jgi:hypothetical protein
VQLDVIVGCVVPILLVSLLVAFSVYVCKKRQLRSVVAPQPQNQYGALALQPPVDYADIADVRAPA